MNTIKTYSSKVGEVEARWSVIDASGQRLGRLATRIAQMLQGKHKPTYTPHVLSGDFVVVVNASKVDVSGRKSVQKRYFRHSGYPGGLRSVPLGEMLERHPERVIQRAVKNMLPGNTLARRMLKRLKVYGGETHPHQAQVSAGTGARSRKRANQIAEAHVGVVHQTNKNPRIAPSVIEQRKATQSAEDRVQGKSKERPVPPVKAKSEEVTALQSQGKGKKPSVPRVKAKSEEATALQSQGKSKKPPVPRVKAKSERTRVSRKPTKAKDTS